MELKLRRGGSSVFPASLCIHRTLAADPPTLTTIHELPSPPTHHTDATTTIKHPYVCLVRREANASEEFSVPSLCGHLRCDKHKTVDR